MTPLLSLRIAFRLSIVRTDPFAFLCVDTQAAGWRFGRDCLVPLTFNGGMRIRAVLFFAACAFAPAAFGQGTLTPPGAPAPTMKTLDQVEARTALPRASDLSNGTVTFPIVISASGSYYLTGNLTVASGDIIQITAQNVTLDLNGFTIATTAGSRSGTAVLISNSRVTVCNGFIYGSGTVSGPDYSGGGFNYGVNTPAMTCDSLVVHDLTVTGCFSYGIKITAGDTETNLAERCTANHTGSAGIFADIVRGCAANKCGGLGISGKEISDSSGTSSGTGIAATNATNCKGVGGTGKGITASGTARGCQGTSTSGTGLSASRVTTCQGFSTSGTGLNADDVGTDCTGTTNSGGYGIYGNVLTNCQGTSSSGANYGVFSNFLATNCRGVSATGVGLRTATAVNCYGQCSSGTSNNPALFAVTATNCRGYQTSGSGTAIQADYAVTCSSQGGAIVAGFKALGTP